MTVSLTTRPQRELEQLVASYDVLHALSEPGGAALRVNLAFPIASR